jgi:hypothetical protein
MASSDFPGQMEELPRPMAFIQWKGTEACADLYCECGEQFHIDADFMYYVRCPHCSRSFAVGCFVPLVPITEDEVADLANPPIIGTP